MKTERGIAMASALITIAALLIAVSVVVQYALSSAGNAGSVQAKQAAFDAAEAGADDAMRALDVAGGVMANGYVSPSTTLANGATYTWTMQVNNLVGTGSQTPAPATTPYISVVPAGTAFITSTASIPGQRAETIGAIVGRSAGIQGPGGAIDAGQNIVDNSHVPIYQSTTNVAADVHANGNIYAGGNTGTVQGSTYAAGTTNQWTTAAGAYSGAAPVTFPSSTQVNAIANEALLLAESGAMVSGANPAGTYTGNVYINGDVNLTSGLITVNGGGTVYINGNVTLSGSGKGKNSGGGFVNNNGSLVVVNGTFSVSGNGFLSVPQGSGGQLMVLATDPNSSLCASGGGGCAMYLGGNSTSVGEIFLPYGSIQVAGNGTILGALAAADDVVFSGGGATGAFQYDPVAGSGTIKAATYVARSFIEN